MIHTLLYNLQETIWSYLLAVFILTASLIALFKFKSELSIKSLVTTPFHGMAFIGLYLLENKAQGTIFWFFISTLLLGLLKCKMAKILVTTDSSTPLVALEKFKIKGAILLNPLYKVIAYIALFLFPLLYIKIGSNEVVKITDLTEGLATISIISLIALYTFLKNKIQYTFLLLLLPFGYLIYLFSNSTISDFSFLGYLKNAVTAQAITGGIVTSLFKEMVIDAAKRATLSTLSTPISTVAKTQSELLFDLVLIILSAPIFLFTQQKDPVISIFTIVMVITCPITLFEKIKKDGARKWHIILSLFSLIALLLSTPTLQYLSDSVGGLLILTLSTTLLITLPKLLGQTNTSY